MVQEVTGIEGRAWNLVRRLGAAATTGLRVQRHSVQLYPDCRLQDFLRPYLSQDACCVDQLLLESVTDMVPISLCCPRHPFWAGLRNNQWAPTRWTGAPRSRVLSPRMLPSGSGLGVCNKEIILKKHMKIITQLDFLIYSVFQVLFLWDFSRLWHIIRNPRYRLRLGTCSCFIGSLMVFSLLVIFSPCA